MEEETEYMKKGWDYNVKNCHVDIERAIMISDDKYNFCWHVYEAGRIIGNLGFDEKCEMRHCGKWYWLSFDEIEDAMAFKLKWE